MKYLSGYNSRQIFNFYHLDAETGQWYRTHGNEHWEFDEEGLMKRRDMSANDVHILESQRKYKI